MRGLVFTVLVSVFLAPAATFALPVECYCVLWLRLVKNVEVRGDAVNIRPNMPLSEAGEGDVLLMKFGNSSDQYHAGLIIDKETRVVDENPYLAKTVRLLMTSANKKRCQVTTEWVEIDDPSIRGIYRPI